ncbi:unnamed protein product, partial [Prorocentrum cordatum]
KTGEGGEGQEGNFPMLVGRDSKTKLPYSTAIPGKKVTNFMIKIQMSFTLHLGYRRLIFQSDGGPAIVALKTAVAVATPTVEFLPRESPAGEHQSNGGIEVTVREVKRQVRATRYALEAKLGRKVDDDHPILKWLPQCAAACIGRHRRGTDGLAGEQRRSGRDWKKLEAEFGERVMYRPLAPGGRGSTMEERVKSGNFLGYHMRTGALLVMAVDGVEKAQGFKILPKEQAWGGMDWAALRGVPWATRPEEQAPALARAPVAATVRMEPRAPRARYVLRRDIEKYGATAGCPGCLELTQKGKITKSHSDECRDRIAELMMGNDEVRVRPETKQHAVEVFEVEKQLEETKLPYRRPLGTAIELLPQSRGAPRWRWCRPEAVEANRALSGSAEETHPTLDELPGYEAMREEAQHLQLLMLGSRSGEQTQRCPRQRHQRFNCYDKGRAFVVICELVMFEMRTNANVNDAEQVEEIAPLLTEICAWKLFLYEAPWSASSWYRPSVQEVMQLAGVFLVHGPICRWHMQSTDSHGKWGFVRKETGWLTNGELLAEILEGYCRCPRGPNGELARHVHLVDGRAKRARRCPPSLVTAILKGLREELRRREGLNLLAALCGGPRPHEEDTEVFAEYQDHYFIDDLTGEILDSEGARAARQEELDWCRGGQVWKKVPRREMLENDKNAVTLQWIDTNKGDRTQPRYRSRLVAREIKKAMRSEDRPDQAELFSAMPPLEAFKAMVTICVGRVNDAYHDGDAEEIIYKFYDISRAHFYGDVNREVYVELPEEETYDDPEPMVGRLLKTMYGTVDAYHVWQDDYIGLTSSHGFVKGVSNPALLYRAERHIQAEVHSDDFGVIMRKSQEGWFEDVLSRYDFKVAGIMSSRPLQEQSVVYLNRRSAYLEADARHVKKVIRDLGLGNAKEVTTPAVKRSVAEILSSNQTSPKSDDEKVKTYRSVTMRIMCLGLDRPDISYSASMQARRMKEPKETRVEDLKRIGRYLKKHRAGRLLFPAQRLPRKACVYCDSDYAGDSITRRSRSGMAILWGTHLLKHGSAVQSAVSLSSGEAEYYALLRGACHGFGVQATSADLGVEVDYEMELYIFSDRSAARGLARRQGLGAVRHLDVQFLWLQERIQNTRLLLKTVDGHWNPADLFTKALDQDTMERLVKLICFAMKFDGNVRHRVL